MQASNMLIIFFCNIRLEQNILLRNVKEMITSGKHATPKENAQLEFSNVSCVKKVNFSLILYSLSCFLMKMIGLYKHTF